LKGLIIKETKISHDFIISEWTDQLYSRNS